MKVCGHGLLLLLVLWPSYFVAQSSLPLPVAIAGTPYAFDLATIVDGGLPPLKFSVAAGQTLPAGLTLEERGTIRGTPTAAQRDPYSFEVLVTDSDNPPHSGRQTIWLKVAGRPLHFHSAVPDPSPTTPSSTEPAPEGGSDGHGRQEARPNDANKSEPQGGTGGKEKTKPEVPILDVPILATDRKISGSISPDSTKVEVLYGGNVYSPENLEKQQKAHPGKFDLTIKDDAPLFPEQSVRVRQNIGDATSDLSPPAIVQAVARHGELATAIVGFEQSGASAAQSRQNFFFNFYISRPLPFDFHHQHPAGEDASAKAAAKEESWDPALRWWGNVRLASYPQQVDVPVAAFASTFATTVGQLKVNQLAQSAEFITGLEYAVWHFSTATFMGRSEDTRQRFTMGFIAGGGATGPLTPESSLAIFATPAANSPQRARFVQTFPQAANSQYIGFVSPDRDRFFHNYFAGLRLTSEYYSAANRVPLNSPPAMVSMSLGQNEVVTGGKLSGVVGRIEAFYPLPLGARKSLSGIYLFGAAMMRMAGGKNIDPFILAPAPDNVHGSDPNVALVSVPSTRDIYRIGVGIDLVSAIHTWTNKTPDTSKATAKNKSNAGNKPPAPKPEGSAHQ